MGDTPTWSPHPAGVGLPYWLGGVDARVVSLSRAPISRFTVCRPFAVHGLIGGALRNGGQMSTARDAMPTAWFRYGATHDDRAGVLRRHLFFPTPKLDCAGKGEKVPGQVRGRGPRRDNSAKSLFEPARGGPQSFDGRCVWIVAAAIAELLFERADRGRARGGIVASQ